MMKIIILFIFLIEISFTNLYQEKQIYNLSLSSYFQKQNILNLQNIETVANLYKNKKINDRQLTEFIKYIKHLSKIRPKDSSLKTSTDLDYFYEFFIRLMLKINYPQLENIKKTIIISNNPSLIIIQIETHSNKKFILFISKSITTLAILKKINTILKTNGIQTTGILETTNKAQYFEYNDKFYYLSEHQETDTFNLNKKIDKIIGKVAALIQNAEQSEDSHILPHYSRINMLPITMESISDFEEQKDRQFREDYQLRRQEDSPKMFQLIFEQISIFNQAFPKIDFTNCKRSIIHGSLKQKHIILNQTNQVMLLSTGFHAFDYRIKEFLDIMNIYNFKKFSDTLLSYQLNLDKPLNKDELRALIEFLRFKYITECDTLKKYHNLKLFSEDFSDENKKNKFIDMIFDCGSIKQKFKEEYAYLGNIVEINLISDIIENPLIQIRTSNGSFLWKSTNPDIQKAKYLVAFNRFLLLNKIPIPKYYKREKGEELNPSSYITRINGRNYILLKFSKEHALTQNSLIYYRRIGSIIADIHHLTINFQFDHMIMKVNELDTAKTIRFSHIQNNASYLRNAFIWRYPEDTQLYDRYIKLYTKHSKIFLKNFKKLKSKLVIVYIHNNIILRNTAFEKNRISMLSDTTTAEKNYRILDLIKLISENLTNQQYNIEHLKQLIIGYQLNTQKKLNKHELRAFIEILRFCLVDPETHPGLSIDEHSKIRPDLNILIKNFEAFDRDFGTKEQIDKFIKNISLEINALNWRMAKTNKTPRYKIMIGIQKLIFKITQTPETQLFQFLKSILNPNELRYYILGIKRHMNKTRQDIHIIKINKILDAI